MVHVLILREAPSFIAGKDLIQGTHEIVEQNISKRAYELNLGRKGYTIATSSEFKLLWYRVKKEALADFITDLCVINLNPGKLPKGFLKGLFFNKSIGQMNQFKFGRLELLLMLILKCVPLLKGVDKLDKTVTPFNKKNHTNYWCYNFFLGYVDDIETNQGEVL